MTVMQGASSALSDACMMGMLKGSWDLVTRVTVRVTILITPIKVRYL